jgi:hypothetical protein
MPELTTIERVGKKSVQFRTTGVSKQCYTVMLVIATDDHQVATICNF